MALEEEILQADSFLKGAAKVVDRGISIFDQVRQTFFPVGVNPRDPAGEEGTGEAVQVASKSAQPNLAPIVVVGVLAYLVLK